MSNPYFCVKCKSELVREAKFCDRCGSPTAESLWIVIHNLEEQVKKLERPPKPQTKRPQPKQSLQLEKSSTTEFLELYRSGLNDREIAQKLHVSPQSIRLWRKKLNLRANAPRGFPKYVIEEKKRQSEARLAELETILKEKGPVKSDDLPYKEGVLSKLLKKAEDDIASVRLRGGRSRGRELFGQLAGKRILYLRGDKRIIEYLARNLNPKTERMYRTIALRLKSSRVPRDVVKRIVDRARTLRTIPPSGEEGVVSTNES